MFRVSQTGVKISNLIDLCNIIFEGLIQTLKQICNKNSYLQ